MSKLTLDDFPYGEWREHDTARCPVCGGTVELRRGLKAKEIGTFSLAGQQMKFSAYDTMEFRCRSCGATGPAEQKPASAVPGKTSDDVGE